MNLSSNSQKWLDTTLYPFENKYIQLDAGKMHYVDEGKGDVILFIHGTPAWSFLYRDYVSSLSEQYRCIAIDHIGFGLSEKPNNFDGRPESHSNNLNSFIEKLNLTAITLVVHDFGGPIGLGTAIQNNNKIKKIILFNSWLWETKNNLNAQKIDKIVNSKIGSFLYLTMNFSPKFLLKKGIYDKGKLSKKVHKQYIYPFPNKASRQSLLNIGKSLVGSSNWYQLQWNLLDKLESKPWLILWGTKDEFITTEYLQKWKDRLPNAVVKEFNCGHFLQEEKAKETITEIKEFMKMDS
ncbi:haloalkane dehalogenase [Winogradskyella eximia]|uniref:Haloalkane dehalogenase n=1 Tax=Winogradskyella eximia TaxID=262006 RepID=A0A3D9H709_9FLAO|nr:alpha/beta fold hydrolase [Winogradskyella eximia]RED45274.1 haloalkane dehalogenase [Winogradskyella eximia]